MIDLAGNLPMEMEVLLRIIVYGGVLITHGTCKCSLE